MASYCKLYIIFGPSLFFLSLSLFIFFLHLLSTKSSNTANNVCLLKPQLITEVKTGTFWFQKSYILSYFIKAQVTK